MLVPFFFFNDTATTEIYTLSLHDALPISIPAERDLARLACRNELADRLQIFELGLFRLEAFALRACRQIVCLVDRKSTRLNSSHANISYAVFCLKKKRLNHMRSRSIFRDE